MSEQTNNETQEQTAETSNAPVSSTNLNEQNAAQQGAQQTQSPAAKPQQNWEYQALQHGWVPPTQDGHQGSQQPGAAPQQQWQQNPQPPQGWQQGQQQPPNTWNQPQQQNGWQQPAQNGWGQNTSQSQPQNQPVQQPQSPDAFNGSTKALWVVAGALAGIFSLLLVLLFGMGRSPQYRAQAIRWACVGIIIGVFVDLALFSFAGITPDMTSGSGSAYPSGGTSPSGSAF